jgi:hypothetical protein
MTSRFATLVLGTTLITSPCLGGDRTLREGGRDLYGNVVVDVLPKSDGVAVTFFGGRAGAAAQVLERAGSNLIAEGTPEDPIIVSSTDGGSTIVGDFNDDGYCDVAFLGEIEETRADIDGDGRADLLTAPGFSGGPRVHAVIFDPGFRGGVFVSAGDVDGERTLVLQQSDRSGNVVFIMTVNPGAVGN